MKWKLKLAKTTATILENESENQWNNDCYSQSEESLKMKAEMAILKIMK